MLQSVIYLAWKIDLDMLSLNVDKIANIIDDPQKEKWWLNRNYWFLGTVGLIVILAIIYGAGGISGSGHQQSNWNDHLNFRNVWQSFINSFNHHSWTHWLANILLTLGLGIYLERKIGTIKFLGLILAMAFFVSMTTSANIQNTWWAGFSGVNFALKSFIVIDCIITLFNNKTRTKLNIIFCSIVIAWIIIAFSVQVDPSFSFRIYPWRNMGHYSGAITGLVFGLIYQLLKLQKPKPVEKVEQ